MSTTKELISNLTLWSSIDKLQEILRRLNNGGDGSGDTTIPVDVFNFTPDFIGFIANGATRQVALKAEGLNWNITSDKSFLTCAPASGTGDAIISVTVTKNEVVGLILLGKLKAKSGVKETFLGIQQNAAEPLPGG